MKLFRYITIGCIWVTAASMLIGCNRPKEIPDDTLVEIFHDAYLTNAYMDEFRIEPDSLLIYEPIFERYGYTIEDVRHSIQTFSERKSALLSDLVSQVYKRLEVESKEAAYKVTILDTLENIAKRAYTHVVYSDSLIYVNSLADTSKLRISARHLIPGEYTVSFDYLVDSLDENRSSRVEVYALTRDSIRSLRHTTMLSRFKPSQYSRKFNIDTTHIELYVNMYYHPSREESKLPDVRINNFEITRVLPAEVALDSLYLKQLNIRIFNHRLMSSFTTDTLSQQEEMPREPHIESDSIE